MTPDDIRAMRDEVDQKELYQLREAWLRGEATDADVLAALLAAVWQMLGREDKRDMHEMERREHNDA